MGKDIHTAGHVSIYGIYFDTGKSEIKPESDLAPVTSNHNEAEKAKNRRLELVKR